MDVVTVALAASSGDFAATSMLLLAAVIRLRRRVASYAATIDTLTSDCMHVWEPWETQPQIPIRDGDKRTDYLCVQERTYSLCGKVERHSELLWANSPTLPKGP